MTDLQQRIINHLDQLSPHIKERKSAILLAEALGELEEVEQACAVEYERLAVLAVKHCPSSHRDFKEIEKLLIIISNKKQSSKDKFKEGE